jgi:hypothetical protein
MCGLAGFIRHPESPDLEISKLLLCDLLQSIESRGRHATGIAAGLSKNDFIWKWAEPATKVLKSKVWADTLEAIHPGTAVVQGHTRWATFDNAREDRAAHPFREGGVVGAHNGVIYNWAEHARKYGRDQGADRLIVDSQAIFLLLDRLESPAEALNLLDGYFAVSWTKGDRFYLARTEDAPLSVAYFPEIRTLYYNSEAAKLTQVLKDAGAKPEQFQQWSPVAGTIYEFDPEKFDDKHAHPVRTEGGFKGRKSYKGWNSARPPMMNGSGREVVRYVDDSHWDDILGRQVGGKEVRAKDERRRPARKGQVSLLDLDKDLEVLFGTMRNMNKRLNKLEKKNEKLEAEVVRLRAQLETVGAEQEYIFDILEEEGFLEAAEENDSQHSLSLEVAGEKVPF